MNIHRIHQIWRLTTTNSSKLELISSLPNEEAISVMEQYFIELQVKLYRDGIKLLQKIGINVLRVREILFKQYQYKVQKFHGLFDDILPLENYYYFRNIFISINLNH